MRRFFTDKMLFAVAVLAPAPLQAQDSAFNDLASSNAIQSMMEANRNIMMDAAEAEDHDYESPATVSLPLRQPLLDYTPSESRTQSNLQNFVDKSRRVDPIGAAELEALFKANNVMALIAQGMSTKGLSVDNVGHAYAVYWISAWQASVGDMSEMSAATYQAVAKQASVALSRTPAFVAAGDAAKQETAEAYLIQTLLVDAANEQAQGKAEQKNVLRSAILKGAKAAGLDLEHMTLTESGFALINP